MRKSVYYTISCEKRGFRVCFEFIPPFYEESFRDILFVLSRSIAGYVTRKNGQKSRKETHGKRIIKEWNKFKTDSKKQ